MQFSLRDKDLVIQALKTVHYVLMDIYVAPSMEIIESDELRKIECFELKVSYLGFNEDEQSKTNKMIEDRVECYILGYLEACKSQGKGENELISCHACETQFRLWEWLDIRNSGYPECPECSTKISEDTLKIICCL